MTFYEERKQLGKCYIFGVDGKQHPTTHIGPMVDIDCEEGMAGHFYITRRCTACGKQWVYEDDEPTPINDAPPVAPPPDAALARYAAEMFGENE